MARETENLYGVERTKNVKIFSSIVSLQYLFGVLLLRPWGAPLISRVQQFPSTYPGTLGCNRRLHWSDLAAIYSLGVMDNS